MLSTGAQSGANNYSTLSRAFKGVDSLHRPDHWSANASTGIGITSLSINRREPDSGVQPAMQRLHKFTEPQSSESLKTVEWANAVSPVSDQLRSNLQPWYRALDKLGKDPACLFSTAPHSSESFVDA